MLVGQYLKLRIELASGVRYPPCGRHRENLLPITLVLSKKERQGRHRMTGKSLGSDGQPEALPKASAVDEVLSALGGPWTAADRQGDQRRTLQKTNRLPSRHSAEAKAG